MYGTVNITAIDTTSGISTVRTADSTFIGIATVGNLVSFTNPGDTVNHILQKLKQYHKTNH
jgi:hypothetical protein